MAWEAISWNAALATFVSTQVGFIAVAMHGVGLPLMPEETGGGREMKILTGNDLAPVWFQVGVNKFAGADNSISIAKVCGERKMLVLVVAL